MAPEVGLEPTTLQLAELNDLELPRLNTAG